MWAFLRVVVFEWVLKRLGLRWLLSLLILGPLAILVFIGLPALLVTVVIAFICWRLVRRKPQAEPVTPAAAPPA